MTHLNLHLIYLITFCIMTLYTNAQTNYNEDNIPDYELPELLTSENGQAVTTQEDWISARRPEILRLFENHMYGSFPTKDVHIEFNIGKIETNALEGKATKKEIQITFSKNEKKVSAHLLIYLPNNIRRPASLFLGLNFFGNHTIHSDPSIPITSSWVMNNSEFQITDHKASESSRGVRTHRWPVEEIVSRGHGLATMYYGDLDPDFDDGFKNGIHALIDEADEKAVDQLSAISAWAYGLSAAMDYFEMDADIDEHRIAVIGHSRLGKAALWAGATDDRFAIVISNDSGCGGAALSRRRFGETVEVINTRFPHWFVRKFHEYNNKEDELPFDQHMLLALMAPRPLYVASAEEDQWADPKGEFLSLFHSGRVYQLFGEDIFTDENIPDVNTPKKAGKMAYHIRTGKHDITTYDWMRYLDFAALHFGQ